MSNNYNLIFVYMYYHKLEMVCLILAMIILTISESNPKDTQKPGLVS